MKFRFKNDRAEKIIPIVLNEMSIVEAVKEVL